MEKGPLDNMATKDKGKVAITAIKYSALDRIMLFRFYNHPQPLWVWADGTSISPKTLNLHVDVGGRVRGRVKSSIKRKKKQFRERGGKSSPRPWSPKKEGIQKRENKNKNIKFHGQDPRTTLAHFYAYTISTMTNHCPVTKV